MEQTKAPKAPKRFALDGTPNRPGWWTVIDTITGVGVTFKFRDYRHTQEITLPNAGHGMTADELAAVPNALRDITEWMMRYHYDLCCPDLYKEREAMGKRIFQLRKDAGMTGAELSRQAGVTEANINRIENGKYSFNFDTLVKLAQAFDMRVDFVPANQTTK